MSAGADVRVRSSGRQLENVRDGLLTLSEDGCKSVAGELLDARAEIATLRAALAAAQEQAAQAERAGLERALAVVQQAFDAPTRGEISRFGLNMALVAIRAALPADSSASVPVSEGER